MEKWGYRTVAGTSSQKKLEERKVGSNEWNWEQDVQKKVRRIVQKTLEDIVPTVDISPKRAERIQDGVREYVEHAVMSYQGKSLKVPARYIATELLEQVEGERDKYVLDEVTGLAGILNTL